MNFKTTLSLTVKHISILVMAVLLCIPCTVKRDLKLAFGVPISSLSVDVKGLNCCANVVNAELELQHAASKFDKRLQPLRRSQINNVIGLSAKPQQLHDCRLWIPWSVPLYQLHGQYLI